MDSLMIIQWLLGVCSFLITVGLGMFGRYWWYKVKHDDMFRVMVMEELGGLKQGQSAAEEIHKGMKDDIRQLGRQNSKLFDRTELQGKDIQYIKGKLAKE